jgi:hypothetical protein
LLLLLLLLLGGVGQGLGEHCVMFVVDCWFWTPVVVDSLNPNCSIAYNHALKLSCLFIPADRQEPNGGSSGVRAAPMVHITGA